MFKSAITSDIGRLLWYEPDLTRLPDLARPQTPLLWTTTRARPSKFKPREVEEEEQLAALPKFHALPLKCGRTFIWLIFLFPC